VIPEPPRPHAAATGVRGTASFRVYAAFMRDGNDSTPSLRRQQ